MSVLLDVSYDWVKMQETMQRGGAVPEDIVAKMIYRKINLSEVDRPVL